MTLSVEMIAESMQPFGARVVMQQERTFAFRRVQMLTPESENTLEEDVLYVSEPKVIRRLPKGLLHDHFFVVRARPEDAEPVRPGVNALLYDEQYSLGAVTNHLLTLFDRLQTLEYQMRLAVRAHAGLEPLMEVGQKMIPDATIVVVDSAYNIIGATRERGSGNIYVDQMLEQGYYDKDSLQLMAEAGYFEVSDRYLRPVLSVPPNICNDPVILRSYIANGMFYSFAGCYFPGRLPTMVDQELFRCFTEQLDHYFRETGFYSQSMPQRQQMIHDLLRYGEENPELVRDRARGLRLPETGDFRLGYVEFDEQASTSKAGYMVLQLRAWSNVANYGVMQYQNSVLILLSGLARLPGRGAAFVPRAVGRAADAAGQEPCAYRREPAVHGAGTPAHGLRSGADRHRDRPQAGSRCAGVSLFQVLSQRHARMLPGKIRAR